MSMFLKRLIEHAAVRPEHIAVVSDDIELTYACLADSVKAACAYLIRQGINSASVVGLTVADEIDHFIATLALLSTGVKQITLASHDPLPVRTQLAERVKVTHLLSTHSDYAIAGREFISWITEIVDPPDGIMKDFDSISDGMLYISTSGTTGNMKIVPFSAAQIAQQAQSHADYKEERLLMMTSVEHNDAKRHRLYCLWMGGTIVFRGNQPGAIADIAMRHKVSCIDVSRMHIAHLLAEKNAHQLNMLRLKAGTAVPVSLRDEIRTKVTEKLYVRYAATECGTIAISCPGQCDEEETVGRVLDNVELQIVDEDLNQLPNGNIGLVKVRTQGMAQGYFDTPEQTGQRFINGWFYPGDLAVMRSDGMLMVQGRKDDMIIMNGINIYPSEIEQVLEELQVVEEVVAFAMPSRIHGQIPVAALVLRPDQPFQHDEIMIYARQHLSLKAPRKLFIMTCFPKNAQGKILRNKIARQLQSTIKAND